MRKTSFSITKCKVRGEIRFKATTPVADGPGRQRRFFVEKEDARTYIELKKREIENHGVRALSLGAQQRADLMWCEEQLKPYGLTVRGAVEMLLPRLKARAHDLTVPEAVKGMLAAKRPEVGERHFYTMENRLKRFSVSFESRTLSSFTAIELRDWLLAMGLGRQSVKHYRATLHSLFAYGVLAGACESNPVADIPKGKKVVRDRPSVLSPKQLSDLFEGCDDDAEMIAYIAVGAFAGLRSAEIHRLQWEQIKFSQGVIDLGTKMTKTSARRLVPIHDSLRAWIEPYAKSSGGLAPAVNFRRRFHTARKNANLLGSWEGNELRHSYASYRLAETRDVAQVAYESGNSPKVLREHYDALVLPEDASRWFGVVPVASGKVVSLASA